MEFDKKYLSEQARKRAQNRYAILRTLQSVEPMKRIELAEHCGIRKSSVTSLVDELLEQKWIRREDEKRPRSPLVINEEYYFVLSVELDADCIRIGRINLQGDIVSLNTYESCIDSKREEIVEFLIHYTKLHLEGLRSARFLGISLSVPGVVDSEKGICVNAINLHDFKNVPLLEIFSKEFSCPVIIENDVRASLYCSLFLERREHALDNAIYLDITSGVGSAILVNGAPLPGSNGASGEIGHLSADQQNRLCRCGQLDCLETYASIPAMCKDINRLFKLDVKTASDIIEAAKSESGVAVVLREACEHIAIPLSVMMAVLDPEVVILGNQSRSFYELLLPGLKDSLTERLNGPAARVLNIEIAPEYSSLRGVAMLLMEKTFQA